MKRADVVIAGLVIVAVFGLVLAGQMVSLTKFMPQNGDAVVVVGACAGGKKNYISNSGACLISGTQYVQDSNGSFTPPRLTGCKSQSVVLCPSQTALWVSGSAEGDFKDTKTPCGGAYTPHTGYSTNHVDRFLWSAFWQTMVYDYTDVYCVPTLGQPTPCGQKNALGGC